MSALVLLLEALAGVDRFVLSIVLNPDYYSKGGKKIRAEDMDSFYTIIALMQGSEVLTCIPDKKKKNGKPVMYHYYLIKEGRTLLHIMTGVIYGNAFIKLGLNPSKTSQEDFAIICTELAAILPPEVDMAAFLVQAEVSLMELFVDLPGVSTDEVIVLAPQSHSHAVVHGTTEYYGTRKSRITVTKYDKAEELKEVHGIPVGNSLTRIEVRVRDHKVSLADMLLKKEVGYYNRIFRYFKLRTGQVVYGRWVAPLINHCSRHGDVDPQALLSHPPSPGEILGRPKVPHLVQLSFSVGEAEGPDSLIRRSTAT
ncbi:MAG: replication initiation factor domain-containing protein [Pseudomonadota bacterium]